MFQDGSEASPTYSRLRCRPCQRGTLGVRVCLATRRVQSQEREPRPQGPNLSHALDPVPTVRRVNGSRNAATVRGKQPQSAVLADQTPRSSPDVNRNLERATSRTPPFTTTQFHVLLNSLFKVLFNFPSRYLFAIGLGVIFSLTWSLPRTLSCTPKQLDSREKVSTPRQPSYGPITLYGPWPQSRWTWTGRLNMRRLSQTPHSARLRQPAVRCWALPVSFAITKGITVVFFSSAY